MIVEVGDRFRNRCGSRTITILTVTRDNAYVKIDGKPETAVMTLRYLRAGDYRKMTE